MPLLFRLAIHDSLVEARQEMCKAHLFAYLDDVCAVCALDQNRSMCNILANKVETGAGISHTGRRELRTARRRAHQTSRTSGTKSGPQKGSKFWRRQWGLTRSSRKL